MVKCKKCGENTNNITSEHCDKCKEKIFVLSRKNRYPEKPYFP